MLSSNKVTCHLMSLTDKTRCNGVILQTLLYSLPTSVRSVWGGERKAPIGDRLGANTILQKQMFVKSKRDQSVGISMRRWMCVRLGGGGGVKVMISWRVFT